MKPTSEHLHDITLSGLNLIKQAISIHDKDLRLLVANHRFQKMFNLPDHLVRSGAEFRDILTYLSEKGDYGEIDDIGAFVDEKIQLARAFEPHYFERTRSNGTSISVEGNPLSQGGWISVYTDITDIKRQEGFIRSHAASLSEKLVQRSEDLAQTNRNLAATITALEAAKEELTNSREHLSLINQMTPAHIAHVSADGVYTHSNGKLPTVLSHVDHQIVGRKFGEVLGANVWAHVGPRFQNVLDGNPSVSEFFDENSERHVRLAMTPDHDDDGDVRGAYILSMDVTKEVSARSAVTHARRRELAAQLTSGMAHDFANLLTIIMGQQAQLEDHAAHNPALAVVSSTIKSAAKRGGELIESLSRIESPRRLDQVTVPLASFLDTVAQLTKAAVPPETTIEIVSSVTDERLVFDPGFAQDAVLNLVLNSSEAMDGEGHVKIEVARSTTNMLEILVLDEGPGFTEDGLTNALAPFHSTKSGKVGRGLGLSAAFDFAKSCGGTLRLRNRIQKGAAVSLRIPYTPVSASRAGLVLLVDDDDDVRASVRGLLRRAGHAVVEAVSVAEASQLVGLDGLTHIVTDLAIGDVETGLDVAALVPRPIPILVITGLPMSNALRQRAERDFHVLSKPFEFEALQQALMRIGAP